MYLEDDSKDDFDYHINTRRICNIVYDNDKFRNISKNKKDIAYVTEKNKEKSQP